MKFKDLLAPYRLYRAARTDGPLQATFDPRRPGVTRIHLVPLKYHLGRRSPSMVFINGWDLFLIGPAWADLLRAFIETLYRQAEPGRRLSKAELDKVLASVLARMRVLYPSVPDETLLADLNEVVSLCIAVAHGGDVPAELRAPIDLWALSKGMRAPHRMDLLVAPMSEAGEWRCPLHCLGCYATGQPAMSIDRSLSTGEWKRIIDACRSAGIPQLTFTGGEPTERADLVELIAHARWHITRLNTNGLNLTPAYARKLFAADLDGVQITLYSDQAALHDALVGRPGAWEKSVAGIRNALHAGLSVSVNTPLVKKNRNYSKTLKFLAGLGVRYASCSGLIPAGAARGQLKAGAALTKTELMDVMRKAVQTARALNLDLSFTSPGWLSKTQLRQLGLAEPFCGACLTNMAVMPNGAVSPCQSWLDDPRGLGNILETPWKKIWDHKQCKRMRAAPQSGCPLKEQSAKGRRS